MSGQNRVRGTGLLAARFRHAGHEQDLERALVLSRAAVERGGRRPLHRVRAAEALALRYVDHGRLADLEAALGDAREACREPATDPDERFVMAEAFAELLVLAYRATGDRDRLSEALAYGDAVERQRPSQPASAPTPRGDRHRVRCRPPQPAAAATRQARTTRQPGRRASRSPVAPAIRPPSR